MGTPALQPRPSLYFASLIKFKIKVLGPKSRIQNARRWAGAALLLCFAIPRRGLAEQPGNVILDSSEQIFCVLAALNTAGYDTGLRIDTGDNTREEVRALLTKRNPPIRGELRKFYAEHQLAHDPGADLGQYISLALLLDPPPGFTFAVGESDLPPDAKAVKGLVPLLKKFYVQANLIDLWTRVRPRYENAIEIYSDKVRRSIALSDAYLRFPSGAYLGRTYTIYLSLLGAREQVQARIYGQNYYLVVTPSREPKIAEIRHQYLHFLLDPLAAKYAAEIHQKAELQALARQAPALGADFKEDFPLLVTECLIRAVELRMDKRLKPQKDLTELTASGLILVPYFYATLQDYEQQNASMMVFYKEMILGIKTRTEQQRLASVKFSPAKPSGEGDATPALSERELLLNQADNLIYQGKYSEARAAFQRVIEKFDPRNERALFGLAVVASNMRKPDLAEEYFQKTLDAARDLRIVTWSHIYLGRLYDLQGKRDAAVKQYRTASLTAAAYPDAARAVENGLQRAFGSK